jgi:CHAT domain-containing protein
MLIGGLTGNAIGSSNGKRGEIYEPLAFAAVTLTKTNLRQTLAGGSYSLAHLATYGRFGSDPRQTFIVTASGTAIDLDSLRSILKQHLSEIDLLVLSACETATGDRRAALGLAGTAIRSGAGSTLASMWSVDDRATAKLMQNFYGSLTQPDGVSKAHALRVAQRATRQQYSHPYYWAPFVLVGNWL